MGRSVQTSSSARLAELPLGTAIFRKVSLRSRLHGGGRGIRTPGTVSRTAVFKTACFNHSHIPPRECEERTHCLRLSLQQGIRTQDEYPQALVPWRRELSKPGPGRSSAV